MSGCVPHHHHHHSLTQTHTAVPNTSAFLLSVSTALLLFPFFVSVSSCLPVGGTHKLLCFALLWFAFLALFVLPLQEEVEGEESRHPRAQIEVEQERKKIKN